MNRKRKRHIDPRDTNWILRADEFRRNNYLAQGDLFSGQSFEIRQIPIKHSEVFKTNDECLIAMNIGSAIGTLAVYMLNKKYPHIDLFDTKKKNRQGHHGFLGIRRNDVTTQPTRWRQGIYYSGETHATYPFMPGGDVYAGHYYALLESTDPITNKTTFEWKDSFRDLIQLHESNGLCQTAAYLYMLCHLNDPLAITIANQLRRVPNKKDFDAHAWDIYGHNYKLLIGWLETIYNMDKSILFDNTNEIYVEYKKFDFAEADSVTQQELEEYFRLVKLYPVTCCQGNGGLLNEVLLIKPHGKQHQSYDTKYMEDELINLEIHNALVPLLQQNQQDPNFNLYPYNIHSSITPLPII